MICTVQQSTATIILRVSCNWLNRYNLEMAEMSKIRTSCNSIAVFNSDNNNSSSSNLKLHTSFIGNILIRKTLLGTLSSYVIGGILYFAGSFQTNCSQFVIRTNNSHMCKKRQKTNTDYNDMFWYVSRIIFIYLFIYYLLIYWFVLTAYCRLYFDNAPVGYELINTDY